MFFYFAVTMTEAYETLQGKSEEREEYFEENLLQNALGDRERMAATKYVAGFITYKVHKMKIQNPNILFYVVLKCYSWIFLVGFSRTRNSSL